MAGIRGWRALASALGGATGAAQRKRAVAEARTAAGDALAASGRHGDALAAYEEALAARPQHYPAGIGRALMLLEIDTQAGLAALDALNRAQPGRLSLYKRRFELHLDAGRYAEASAVLDEAAAALPAEQRIEVYRKRLRDRQTREEREGPTLPDLFPRVRRPGAISSGEIGRLRGSLRTLERHALRERTLRSRDLLARVASEGDLDCAGLVDRIRAMPVELIGPALGTVQGLNGPRARAYCALARVVASQELTPADPDAARILYDFIRHAAPKSLREIDWIQLLLLPPGPGGAERGLADLAASGLATSDRVEFALVYANLMQARAQERGERGYGTENLHVLNLLYAQEGLEGIRITDPARPLASVETAPLADVVEEGPLVTVVMTTFNADHSIDLAMRSVLGQSWRNLELIVVDDCSEPDSFALVKAWEARDPRIRVLRNDRNQGTYVAKNRGLAEARGEFVTCHDADDWSHPRKLETQVDSLVREGKIAGYSRWARCTPELRFQMFFGGGRLAYYNLSSMMFRRAPVLERVGYFDSVRTGADSEYRARIELAFGEAALEAGRVPLSFGQVHDLSLTANSLGRGWFSPDRLDYRSAWRRWHEQARGSDSALFVPQQPDRRAFAVTQSLQPDRPPAEERAHRSFGLVLIGDFRRQGPAVRHAIAEIDTRRGSGERVAICQMAGWAADTIDLEFLLAGIQDRLSLGLADRVHLADGIDAGRVEILSPEAFDFDETEPCGITARELFVVAEQPAGAAPVVRYDPARTIETIARHFGRAPIWIGGCPAAPAAT